MARLRRADGGDVALRIVASGGKGRELAIRYAAVAEFQQSRSLARLPAAIDVVERGLPSLDAMDGLFATSMEWIAGPTLLQGIDRAANAGNVEVIRALSAAFIQFWNDMQKVEFVHGDYTAQNLVVRSNGQLACVDLDGAAWNDAPFGPTGQGTPGYRHPTVFRDATLRDAFAALLIVTSLAVLADVPELRSLYGDPASTIDGSLLFSAWDLADPSTSRAFAEATARVTAPTRALLEGLQGACAGNALDVYDACALLPRMRMPAPASMESTSVRSGWDV
ncbi:MAG: phosphotransferase, partial [Chloroflexota bacterium]|nr:phosphotransferase [Chloroflexota bacterium]